MAIYHVSAQMIGRSGGRSAIACASYRAGEKMIDKTTGEVKDYTAKDHVDYSNILKPETGCLWHGKNREELWNKVHESETRKNSQFCREFNVALPKELGRDDQIKLAETWVKKNFCNLGMIADLNCHNLNKDNPHFHVMLTTRKVAKGNTFSKKKERAWNDKKLMGVWRENWAKTTNQFLEQAGSQERISHKSLDAQGIDREPEIHLGAKPHPERVLRNDNIKIRNEENAKEKEDIELLKSEISKDEETILSSIKVRNFSDIDKKCNDMKIEIRGMSIALAEAKERNEKALESAKKDLWKPWKIIKTFKAIDANNLEAQKVATLSKQYTEYKKIEAFLVTKKDDLYAQEAPDRKRKIERLKREGIAERLAAASAAKEAAPAAKEAAPAAKEAAPAAKEKEAVQRKERAEAFKLKHLAERNRQKGQDNER